MTLTYSTPRQVADGPRGEDVFKCQLKAFDAASADYGGAVFSAAQLTRLKAVFPDGVCDWTKPGIGQTTPWQPTSFANGPSGTVIPPPPSAVVF